MVRKVENKINAIEDIGIIKRIVFLCGGLIIAFYVSNKNFVLFHGAVLLIDIILVFSILLIAINTYNVAKEYYFVFLGIAYGFAGGFYLLHFLATNEIKFFIQSTDISTAFWMVARYIECISLLTASIFFYRSVKTKVIFFYYFIVAVVSLIIVINWDTIFKNISNRFNNISELAIIGILTIAVVLLIKNKYYFKPNLYKFMFVFIMASVASQVLFVLDIQAYNISNKLGHILNLLSIYYIYIAVCETSIKMPYRLLEDVNENLKYKTLQLEKANKELKEENMANERLARSLRESEKILRAILDSTESGILVIDNYNKIVHMNNNFIKMCRIPKDLLNTGDNNKIISFISMQLNNPLQFILKIHELSNKEKKVIDKLYFKDDRVFERIICPLVMENYSAGQVYIFVDITHKRKMQERIKESENLYRTLVESSMDGIFIHDGEKILFANKSGVKMLGASKPKEIIGKSIMDFVHPDYYDLVKKRMFSIKRNDKIQPLIQEKLIRMDGSVIEVEAITIPMNYKQHNAMLTTFRDISERKKAEKLYKEIQIKDKLLQKEREYNELKNQFFSEISHELKTPINVILGTLQLMSLYNNKEYTYDKMNKHISIMKQNCYRLIRLVNNIIDINKISKGYFNIHLKNKDIVNIIEEICFSVADYAKNKGIDLIFDTDVEEKIIACDIDKIERIILNLLSNAIKFTDPGGIITVIINDKGNKLDIIVRDTGVGIPNDEISRIFDRFSQVESTIKRNKQGSGIGLSLVKSLVEMHNGSISVKSEVGKGTEFTIELPVKVLSEDDNIYVKESDTKESRIERIHIEFSDIYTKEE